MSQVWLITGTSRGLGLSILMAALSAGHTVIATARNPNTPNLTTLTSDYPPSKLLTLPLDVTSEAQVSSVVSQALETFGRIDVLVNNAGYANLAPVEDISTADFKQQLDTNFLGVVYMTKAVLPIMREQQRGHIFQISSLGARLGSPGLSAYQSAKWAVGGFSTVLAQEVAPFGIKVTVLEPGAVRTDWAGSSMEIPKMSEAYEQSVGRMGEYLRSMSGKEASLPEKVAGIVLKVSELGREGDVPLRLLVGGDAVQYAKESARVLKEGDERWEELSLSSS